jgi:hypothetical protein
VADKAYRFFFTGDNGSIIELVGKIDLVSEFSQQDSSKITDVPVESGGSISDHVIDQPVSLNLSAIVTNLYYDSAPAPMNDFVSQDYIGMPSSLDDTGTDLLAIAYDMISKNLNSLSVKAGRPQAVYDELRQFKKKRIFFTIHSMLGIYENMLIEDLSATEDSTTGTALFVRIGMKEVRFAESKVRTEVVVIDSKKTKTNKSFARLLDALGEGPTTEEKKEAEKQAFISSCPSVSTSAPKARQVLRDATNPTALKPGGYANYSQWYDKAPSNLRDVANPPTRIVEGVYGETIQGRRANGRWMPARNVPMPTRTMTR